MYHVPDGARKRTREIYRRSLPMTRLVHTLIMTEGEPFSGNKSSPDNSSSQLLRGDGETRSLDSAEVASSTTLPATEPELEVTGHGVSPTEACDLDRNDSKRGVKRSREIEPMDHSGLERKVPRVLSRVGAVQCLSPLSLEELKLLSSSEGGEELARCLEEPKVPLIQEVVRIMGIEKAFEMFKQTSDIQSQGGQVAADANYKKSPGGVFLALVKKAATKEQKDEIFKYDKQKKSVKKKENKKRKARENRLRKQKEALDSAANTSSINGTSQNEPMEMDVSDAVSTSRPVEAKAGAAAGSERKSAGRSTDVPVQQEILAAEEFERTTDCNVEFEFHVD